MTPAPPAPASGRNFVAGAWIDAVTGRTFESRSPADGGDLVGTFPSSGAADVAMAVRAAETAFPAWRATPAPKRGSAGR